MSWNDRIATRATVASRAAWFAADLAHLQGLYNEINQVGGGQVLTCPQCQHTFEAEPVGAGGS